MEILSYILSLLGLASMVTASLIKGEKMKKILATDYYHISLSQDVVGIESAVALKNGYALAVALTIGVNQREFGIDSALHFNSQAAVFGQSVKEMAKLLEGRESDIIYVAERSEDEDIFLFGPDLVAQLRKKQNVMMDHYLELQRLWARHN